MDSIQEIIHLALSEDIADGDVTGNAVVPTKLKAKAVVSAKEDIILCGAPLAASIFYALDKNANVRIFKKEGSKIKRGETIMEITGSARALLAGERTALNFMQRLSGISTLTGKFKAKTKGTKVKILDTRKTIPGWRLMEKYAVMCGGGTNHRIGLFDMFLIKNNHVDIAGSVTEAALRAKASGKKNLKLEIEVRDMNELKEALICGADIIMLDNFTPANIKKALKVARQFKKYIRRLPSFEASGGITLQNIRAYARTGVDLISIGALTHSARAVDIHMQISAC